MTLPTPLSDRSRTAARRPTLRANARGFTLLEMMVTIGILLVLMGIVSVGLYSVIGGNQRKQTEAILKRAQSFTAEISNTKQARDSFYQRVMWTTYSLTPAAASTAVPVTAGNAASFNSTVSITSYLLSFKPNRDAAQKLPPRNLSDMPSGPRVAFTGTDGQLIANVLMDAWGNPIVFVADGFEYLNPTNNVALPATGAGGVAGLTSTVAGGAVNTTGLAPARFTAPDRRPFWFSAGPDGNYATHDDNVYSFN